MCHCLAVPALPVALLFRMLSIGQFCIDKWSQLWHRVTEALHSHFIGGHFVWSDWIKILWAETMIRSKAESPTQNAELEWNCCLGWYCWHWIFSVLKERYQLDGCVFCVLWYARLICRTDLLLDVCLMMGGGAQNQQSFSLQFLPHLFSFIVFLHFIIAAEEYVPLIEQMVTHIYNWSPYVITSVIKTSDSVTFFQSCKQTMKWRICWRRSFSMRRFDALVHAGGSCGAPGRCFWPWQRLLWWWARCFTSPRLPC